MGKLSLFRKYGTEREVVACHVFIISGIGTLYLGQTVMALHSLQHQHFLPSHCCFSGPVHFVFSIARVSSPPLSLTLFQKTFPCSGKATPIRCVVGEQMLP